MLRPTRGRYAPLNAWANCQRGSRRRSSGSSRRRSRPPLQETLLVSADDTLTDVNISCSDLPLWREGCCKPFQTPPRCPTQRNSEPDPAVTSRVSGHERPKVAAGSSVSKTGNYKTSDPTEVKLNHTSSRMKTNVRHAWRFSPDKNDNVICRLNEPGFVLT